MKVTTCPTEEVFEDPFPQDLESLFLKEDIVSTKSSSEDNIKGSVVYVVGGRSDGTVSLSIPLAMDHQCL